MKYISVVIPTYNRKLLLKSCLDSLANQTYPGSHYEVIVVDDGSVDGTESFVNEYKKNSQFKLLYNRQRNQGPSAARNAGIGQAKGDIIAFTDDDCAADASWLEESVKYFDADGVGGVGGAVEQKTDGIISEFMDYHKVLQPPVLNGEILYLVTANAFYRKDALIAVSGFEEKIRNPGGEDPDLSMKVKEKGYILKYNPQSIVYHYHKDNIRSFYKTFCNYGRGSRYLWDKWGTKLLKRPMRSTAREILNMYNLEILYGYVRYAGIKNILPFSLFRIIQIYASCKGFQKRY